MDEPIAKIGFTLCTSIEAEDVLREINEYITNFIKSDEYDEFCERVRDTSGFKMKDVPTLSEGKKLRVGYVPDTYPQSYYDISTGSAAGYAIELIKKFAYEYGYIPEFIECTFEDAYLKLAYNQVDLASTGTTDVYREETEMSGHEHMTEAFLYSDVVLLKLADGQEMKITGEIEY